MIVTRDCGQPVRRTLLRNHLLYRCTAKGAKAKADNPTSAVIVAKKCARQDCNNPSASETARYCGKACRRKVEREKERVRHAEKPCAWQGCGAPFKPRSAESLYCSGRCSNAAKNARRRGKVVAPAGPPERRTCALDGCELEFEVQRSNPRQGFCCPEHWSKGRGKDSIVSEEEREDLHMAPRRLREAEVALEARRLEAEQEERREKSYALWGSLLGFTLEAG